MLHSASSRNSEVSLESCFQARRQENAEENTVWLVLWVIPCVMAIPWIGLTPTDLIFLKTIMIVERTIVGGVLSALYSQGVTSQFLREGLITNVVWIVMNWVLDFVALLSFSGHSVSRYSIEIVARYLGMAVSLVAIGYVLEHKLRENLEGTA